MIENHIVPGAVLEVLVPRILADNPTQETRYRILRHPNLPGTVLQSMISETLPGLPVTPEEFFRARFASINQAIERLQSGTATRADIDQLLGHLAAAQRFLQIRIGTWGGGMFTTTNQIGVVYVPYPGGRVYWAISTEMTRERVQAAIQSYFEQLDLLLPGYEPPGAQPDPMSSDPPLPATEPVVEQPVIAPLPPQEADGLLPVP